MRNKKQPVEFVDGLAIMPEHGLIVSLTEYDPVVAPSSPKPEKDSVGGSSDVSDWGEENDFPQKVMEKVYEDTELPALLDYKGRVLQGREVIAVQIVFNDETKEFDQHVIKDPEINDFLNHRTFKRYWREACVDFTWWGNIFPDMIKSKGGDSIAYLGTHEAAWCRYNKQNNKGLITKCYVAANWPDAKPEDPTTTEHPVIDPYDPEVVSRLKAKSKIKRFVYPVNYPTPGKAYYSLAAWIPFVFSKWFDLKKMIPEMKVNLMKKVLSAKYILQIPTNYWKTQHENWEGLTKEQRLEIKKAKTKEINNSITGIDKAGGTILCEVGFDEQGKEIPGFKITPIEDALKDGQYLPDSQEASEHGMRAMNVDQTLVGEGPGKKNGGGGGSDKRMAFNIQVATLQPYREVILEPLYFKAEYDGWTDKYPGLRFKVQEVILETLDKSHKTSEEVVK